SRLGSSLSLKTEVKGSIITPYKAGGPFLPLVEPEAASLPLVGVGLSTSQPPPYTVKDGVGLSTSQPPPYTVKDDAASSNVLNWEERLQIGSDAAHGLEYLHHGCKPPIVHRDIKCTNILLNETFQAKLADFGLSRAFPSDGGTHISTAVAGTPGYLDPEYYTSTRLTEKSDVYSFGVVLLVLITGQPAVTTHDNDNIHISGWVSLKLAEGNVKSIVDSRLLDDFDMNSAWRAVELAMACVADIPNRRPTMKDVVMELDDCLVTDLEGVYDPNPR
ncbi:putative leucine-rich repeat receptor-like protein kinase, partial [Tanacetum coccineum]